MSPQTRAFPSMIAIAAVTAMAWTFGTSQTTQAQGGAAAQGPPPARTQVTTTQVKPEMLTAWQELQRNEVVPALKKAGVPWRWCSPAAHPWVRGSRLRPPPARELRSDRSGPGAPEGARR